PPNHRLRPMTVTLSAIRIYPVKSGRGIDLSEWEVDAFGLRWDRRFMVVDAEGEFITQRTEPILATLQAEVTTIADDSPILRLAANHQPTIDVPLTGPGTTRRSVQVWRSSPDVVDLGEAAATWVTRLLDRPARLVFMDRVGARLANPEYAPDGTPVGFADGYPFLIATEESLVDLNRRLDAPVPMDRFRPNLVLRGASPFEEDTWRRLRIGDLVLDIVKPCARCAVITVDQEEGRSRGKEPLRTLATFRTEARGVIFGQNAVHGGPANVRIGDPVEVLARRDPGEGSAPRI
ncbi:MAG: MOSC domain-containing protein, partial [Myxococcales bacterium]|nr:MOSC domain-containing protein [Myxococcales bacterium]